MNTTMIYRYCLILTGFILVFFTACKKHEADDKLGQVLFSDANSLIVPNTPDAPDFAKLYKLTESDRLQELKYKARDGSDMGYHYIPEAIYDLNRDFFMLLLSVNNSVPKVYENYLVRLSDGNAFEISTDNCPMKSGQDGWTTNYDVRAIKKGNDTVFFSLTENQLHRIIITGKDRFEFKTFDISGIVFNNYDVSYEGHVMIGNTYFVSPDSMFTTTVYEYGNSYIAKAYDNGFNVIKLRGDSIQIFHLYLQDKVLHEDSITTLSQDNTDWQFRGVLSFPDYYQTLVVFDKGIVCITKTAVKMLNLAKFSMNYIEMIDQSRTNYYLVGTNLGNNKIFVKLNPAYDPPAYSDLVTPNLFDIKNLHVSGDNTVTIMGIRIADQTDVFRYIRQSGTLKDVLNYQAISTKQVFTVK